MLVLNSLFKLTALTWERLFSFVTHVQAIYAYEITGGFFVSSILAVGVDREGRISPPLPDRFATAENVSLPPFGTKVLSDEFEPVSVCHGNREPTRNKVDATR